MNLTPEQIEQEFTRQVYLNSGLGYDKMIEIVNKQFNLAEQSDEKPDLKEMGRRLDEAIASDVTAFEILSAKHDYIQKNGEKPSEYIEDKIIEAMEEYARIKVQQARENQSERLIIFFRWIKENKHRYMIVDEKRFVQEFLLINPR